MPPTPITESVPPKTAVNTNWRLPMLPITGPMILAYLLAFAALSNKASFNASNSSSDFLSWLKTFTTRWPFMRSSTNPVTSASATCWRTKYLPLFPPIAFVTRIKMPITATASSVSRGLNTSMAINVTIIVKKDISACGIDWLIIWRRVSVSFV